MSPWAISRAVLATYRRHWVALFGSALVVFGTINAVEAALPEVELHRLEVRGLLAGVVLGLLAAGSHAFGEAFYEGVVAAHAIGWRTGGPPPRLRVLVRSIAYLTLIAVNFVTAAGTVIGLFALFVPGVVFGTYVSIAPALVEVEHLGVRASLLRSFELLRGFFWPMLLLAWGAYLLSLAAGQALESLLEGVLAETVAVIVAEALLAPFYGLATVLAAFELIERMDGPPAGGPPRRDPG